MSRNPFAFLRALQVARPLRWLVPAPQGQRKPAEEKERYQSHQEKVIVHSHRNPSFFSGHENHPSSLLRKKANANNICKKPKNNNIHWSKADIRSEIRRTKAEIIKPTPTFLMASAKNLSIKPFYREVRTGRDRGCPPRPVLILYALLIVGLTFLCVKLAEENRRLSAELSKWEGFERHTLPTKPR